MASPVAAVPARRRSWRRFKLIRKADPAGDQHDLGELGLELSGGRLCCAETAAKLDRGDALYGV